MANGHGAARAVILAHIDRGRRRTVATLIARVVVDHDDERQTSLDFGGDRHGERPARRRHASGVIACDALDALEAEIGGAA